MRGHVVKLPDERRLKLKPRRFGIDVPGIWTVEDNGAVGAEVRAVECKGFIGQVRPKLVSRRVRSTRIVKEKVVPIELTP